MADYSFVSLTTAIVGFGTTVALTYVNQIVTPTIETSNGTVNVGDISSGIGTAVPGFLTGRRPQLGQLYPRGVYNK
jgi:hypothetical protein